MEQQYSQKKLEAMTYKFWEIVTDLEEKVFHESLNFSQFNSLMTLYGKAMQFSKTTSLMNVFKNKIKELAQNGYVRTTFSSFFPLSTKELNAHCENEAEKFELLCSNCEKLINEDQENQEANMRKDSEESNSELINQYSQEIISYFMQERQGYEKIYENIIKECRDLQINKEDSINKKYEDDIKSIKSKLKNSNQNLVDTMIGKLIENKKKELDEIKSSIMLFQNEKISTLTKEFMNSLEENCSKLTNRTFSETKENDE